MVNDQSYCLQTLLDLLYHEVNRQNLSPEMELMLYEHLIDCPCCRKKVRNFQQVLAEEPCVKESWIDEILRSDSDDGIPQRAESDFVQAVPGFSRL